ncbi:MAG: polysaccharide biosynthesis tyrosine autokinase [Cytophagales bacterium]|nr:polysaccharide biosynthesis tyrosine autokinase [Cytophagales bacterium]
MDNQNNKYQEQEETIDIKALFFKFYRHWHYFVIAILVALSTAFIIIRYSERIYKVSATVLIRDESNTSLGAENLMEELELFSRRTNLENEIGVLRSYNMINNAISKLDFDVSYFSEGRIRSVQRYKDFPFRVELDSTSSQLIDVRFYLKSLSNGKYQIKAKQDDILVYDRVDNKVFRKKDEEVNINKTFNFYQPFKSENLAFTIYPQQVTNAHYKKSDKFYFVINDLDKVVEDYRNKITIESINRNASILELTVEGPVVEKEIDFINKLAEVYIGSGLDEKNQIAINTINFIDDQLTGIIESLQRTEKELELFRATNKIMDLSYAATNAFDKLEELESQRGIFILKTKYYEYILDYLENDNDIYQIVAPSAVGIDDPLLNNLIGELSKFNAEKNALSYSAKEKNPYLKVLGLKIESTKRSLVENINNLINSTKISVSDIDDRIAVIENSINRLPNTERRLVNIQRQFNLNDNIYTYLLEKRAEAGIAKASNTPDNRIVDNARVAGKGPVSPSIPLFFTVALVSAFIFPTIYIILKDILNDKIIDKKDLEDNTKIPILGAVGHSATGRAGIVIENPKSAIAESFRSLRINLQYLAAGKDKKVIAIISSISEEGKTFCAINLASILAFSGKKILLFGTDLRKPKIHDDFNIDNKIGLTTYLIGKCSVADMTQSSKVENLDIITSGPIPPNPAELLGIPPMDELMKQLKSRYDYIVLDTPPIGLVSDYFVLMKYVDVNIYIVRHNYTNKNLLSKINDLYDSGRINNLSIIINDIKPVGIGYGYGYRYGYGYGYGYGRHYGYYEDGMDKGENFIKRLFKRKN